MAGIVEPPGDPARADNLAAGDQSVDLVHAIRDDVARDACSRATA
jgi:hypothetical protein